MAVPARRATEDDLRTTPRDGRKYELVDGVIRVSPAGDRHEAVALKLAARLLAHGSERNAGHAFGSSAGYRLPGGNVRSDLAPDLAVEVLSPSERPRHVLDKVGEYLEGATSCNSRTRPTRTAAPPSGPRAPRAARGCSRPPAP